MFTSKTNLKVLAVASKHGLGSLQVMAEVFGAKC